MNSRFLVSHTPSPRPALWPALALAALALASAPGAQGVRVSAPPAPAQSISSFAMSPDGRRVVYETPTSTGSELWSMPISGRGNAVSLHDPLEGYLPWGFQIGPGSDRVLYIAVDPVTVQDELFSIAIDGHGGRVKLNAPLATTYQRVWENYVVTPDGREVVYLAPQDSLHDELYVVPIDRSLPPRKLNGSLVAGGSVSYWFQLSADGTNVVYRASQDIASVAELYSVPLDGSRAPVKLNQPLGASQYLMPDFAITADGAHVLFRIGIHELYSVPMDGSQSPVRLDSTVFPNNGILRYLATADGTRVVYVADMFYPNGYELFSVPVDASAPILRLNDPVPSDVFAAVCTPDGAHVLFTVGVPGGGGAQDLYVVPIDDSAPPQKLNGGTIPGTGLSPTLFVLSADGQRVVYRADQDAAGIFELYSVPVDGSQPSVRLNTPLDAFEHRSVWDYRLAPDGRTLVYRANQEAVYRFELFQVPLDGHAAARKVNAELVPGGNVGLVQDPGNHFPLLPGDFFQFAAGGELVYLADQETDNTYELFGSFLTRPDARASTPTRTVTVTR